MKIFMYKARKSLFSALALTLSIGSCYAFSLFSGPLSESLSLSKTAVQFAFCLNIFFLGMGAAFFGSFVEKNIKRAAWISSILFCSGFVLTGLAVEFGIPALLYVGFGVFSGLGEGVGYVTPVKNLLLFFGKSGHKALITAISIVSFGLGSSLCSFVFAYVFPAFGLAGTFWFFAAFYFCSTAFAAISIDKPKFAKSRKTAGKKFSAAKYFKDPYFLRCWTFMFLNISAGLVVIGRCAGMLKSGGLTESAVVATMMVCGFSNGFGRIIFPAVSDYVEKRVDVLSFAVVAEAVALTIGIFDARFLPVSFVVVNACYGCGFALLPAVLSDRYGNSELSFAHGLCLSAWGIASLFAFAVSACVLSVFESSTEILFGSLVAIYVFNFFNLTAMRKSA